MIPLSQIIVYLTQDMEQPELMNCWGDHCHFFPYVVSLWCYLLLHLHDWKQHLALRCKSFNTMKKILKVENSVTHLKLRKHWGTLISRERPENDHKRIRQVEKKSGRAFRLGTEKVCGDNEFFLSFIPITKQRVPVNNREHIFFEKKVSKLLPCLKENLLPMCFWAPSHKDVEVYKKFHLIPVT